MLPSENETDSIRYMVYATEKKIGIHQIPFDGNPHKSAAITAHPSGVSKGKGNGITVYTIEVSMGLGAIEFTLVI